MHTSSYDEPDGGETQFIHNGDYSDTVTILTWTPDRRDNDRIVVPFDNLAAFVLSYLAKRQVEFLEQASRDQLERYFLRGAAE